MEKERRRKVKNDMFVKKKRLSSPLSCPASESATVEYLKDHFDGDVDPSCTYRYPDKLGDRQHEIVQEHSRQVHAGHSGWMKKV